MLIYEIGELEDQFVDRYDQYRVTMKSIRNIEASVQPSRDRELSPWPSTVTQWTDTCTRQAEDHRPNRHAQVQGAKQPEDCCP